MTYFEKLNDDEPLSAYELAYYSGGINHNTARGALNFNAILTRLASWFTEIGPNVLDEVVGLIPTNVFNQKGLFNFGKHQSYYAYVTDLTGKAWQPEVLGTVPMNSMCLVGGDNSAWIGAPKRGLATDFAGALVAVVLMVVMAKFGMRLIGSALTFRANKATTAFREQVLEALGDTKNEVSPVSGLDLNGSNLEEAMALLCHALDVDRDMFLKQARALLVD